MTDFTTDNTLQHVLQELDLERKAILAARNKSYIVIAAGAVLLPGAIFMDVLSLPLLIISIGIVIFGIILIVRTNRPYALYKDTYKRRVAGAALRNIDPSMSLEPHDGMTETEFNNSYLFTTEPDRYYSEDQITGKAGKTSFSFSEVHAEYKTVSTDSKGRKTEHWHEIFKGIIFIADFNKNFQGVTVVRPKDIGSSISSWISKAVPLFSSGDKQLIELENIEFSKEFITHSNDQVEARYILTPAMMDKLCELNSRCQYTISLSFIYSSVYIAFPMNRNYFEAPLYKSILDPAFLEKDISLARFFYEIVNDLGLNTRIWGKE